MARLVDIQERGIHRSGNGAYEVRTRDFKARPRVSSIAWVIAVMCVFLVPEHASSQQASSLTCLPATGWTRLVSPEGETSVADSAQQWPDLLTVAAGWGAPGVLYAGGRQALNRSDDCGLTWVTVYEPQINSHGVRPGWTVAALAAGRNGRLYVAHGSAMWIQVSNDGGVAWRDSDLLGRPGSLLVSPSNPDIAYVYGLDTGAMRSMHRAIFRTTDGGQTWQRQPTITPGGAPLVDPDDSSIVYALGNGTVLRSVDAAMSFEYHGTYDQLALPGAAGQGRNQGGRATMSLDRSRMWFVGASGGMYVSMDQGVTWERLADVPFGGAVRSVSASPHDSRVFFAVAHGDELWAYREPETEASAAR